MEFRWTSESYEGKKKQWHKNMKNINFVPEDIQIILSSHESSEKYNEQDVFYIKSCT